VAVVDVDGSRATTAHGASHPVPDEVGNIAGAMASSKAIDTGGVGRRVYGTTDNQTEDDGRKKPIRHCKEPA